jgi:hypothetical protein
MKGARLGIVVYEREKTLYAEPENAVLLLKRSKSQAVVADVIASAAASITTDAMTLIPTSAVGADMAR